MTRGERVTMGSTASEDTDRVSSTVFPAASEALTHYLVPTDIQRHMVRHAGP